MQLMAPLDVGVVGGGGFSLRREEFPHRPRRTVSCALLPLLLQRGGCQSVRDVTVMILLLRTVYVHVSYSCTRVGTSRRVVQERSAKSVWSPLFVSLALVRSHLVARSSGSSSLRSPQSLRNTQVTMSLTALGVDATSEIASDKTCA